ncbi:MAG: phage holin family protein [Candidatus Nanopelagicales bacterium]|jgi:hypothetical protein
MPDTTPAGEASIKALVAAAVTDLQRLIKAQIALAKLELQQSGRAAGKTGIFIVGALSMAAMGGIFLLVTLAYVLVALGLPVWAGFGIVTLVLFLVAAVLGLLGKKASSKIKGPDRTIAQIEQTKAALQSAVEQPADVQRALPER